MGFTFKPDVSGAYRGNDEFEVENTTETKPKRFDMCYVDADTILHSAAISLQQNYINVKHIESGRVRRFKDKTSFGVRGGKIIPFNVEKDKLPAKGKEPNTKWLGWTNHTRLEKGLEEFSLDDFEIEEMSELKQDFNEFDKALEQGLSSIGFTVGGIKKYADSEDYRLIISGGKGNYRNGEAKTLKYKGNRGEKPILYAELKEAMIDQYKQRVILANGVEAEDICGWYAKEEEDRVGGDFDKWKVCIAYVDKDVDMVYAPSINYQKFENGFRFPTKSDCTKCQVTQIICGDTACDNIMGLPKLAEEATKKFGLRKANGCGKQTALNLLETATTEKDMYERAVFAYQTYYGMSPVKFKDWEGNELTWTWLDYMQETAILVKMQEFEGQMFSVEDKLRELDIPYKTKLYEELAPVLKTGKALEAELELLSTTLNTLIADTKPVKSETKPLQIERLERTMNTLKEVVSSLDDFYEESEIL